MPRAINTVLYREKQINTLKNALMANAELVVLLSGPASSGKSYTVDAVAKSNNFKLACFIDAQEIEAGLLSFCGSVLKKLRTVAKIKNSRSNFKTQKLSKLDDLNILNEFVSAARRILKSWNSDDLALILIDKADILLTTPEPELATKSQNALLRVLTNLPKFNSKVRVILMSHLDFTEFNFRASCGKIYFTDIQNIQFPQYGKEEIVNIILLRRNEYAQESHFQQHVTSVVNRNFLYCKDLKKLESIVEHDNRKST